jgi:hypothetical protein
VASLNVSLGMRRKMNIEAFKYNLRLLRLRGNKIVDLHVIQKPKRFIPFVRREVTSMKTWKGTGI